MIPGLRFLASPLPLVRQACWPMPSSFTLGACSLLVASAICIDAFVVPSRPLKSATLTATSRQSRVTVSICNGFFAPDPEKQQRQQEDYLRQQEILRLRQNKKASDKYFNEVNQRRAQVAKNAKERFDLSKGGKQDPMLKWVQLRKDGKIPEREKYEGLETNRGFIIPTVPFGKPAYDDGVRFDLRMPYVDEGYVDPEASLGNSVKRLFGFGKPTSIPSDAPAPKEDPKKEVKRPWPF